MLLVKLAYRNLTGAGLRSWLNVFVLSLAYVLIIMHQGIFSGMLRQGSTVKIDDQIAGGQYWIKEYDPLDVLTLDRSHGVIPAQLKLLIDLKLATPVLIRPAAIFPEGRMQNVLLRGIDWKQQVLKIPSYKLNIEDIDFPVLIGQRMAKNLSLDNADKLTIRWRDVHGTFDAIEGTIVGIMTTQVPAIDKGQLWVPLEKLQKLTLMDNEATMVILAQDTSVQPRVTDWDFKDQAFLLKDINEMVQSKRFSSIILYSILLFLAMVAVFDTQVLAIFKRRKEIGTLIALGMTRNRVISLFTLEGAMNGVLAIGVGALYGIPLLVVFSRAGIQFPEAVEGYGFAMPTHLFPYYTLGLVLTTLSIIMITVTIVSYIPSRKIARLSPTEALKGRIQ